jgi:hypothetical protein
MGLRSVVTLLERRCNVDKKELDKYYSMEEKQKRLKPPPAKAKPVASAAKRLLDEERKPIAARAKPVGREGKKGVMTAAEARERTDYARELNKAIQSSAKSNGSRGSGGIGGGGGMFPDTEKVPGKRPLKMKHGGMVKSSASKRADGIAKKGKTKGRII